MPSLKIDASALLSCNRSCSPVVIAIQRVRHTLTLITITGRDAIDTDHQSEIRLMLMCTVIQLY